MRFVVDANLPPRLAGFLTERGHDAVHVESLTIGVTAPDPEIVTWAEANGAVVVTQDSDFRSLQLATGRPTGLLMVATGNIRTRELLALIADRLSDIETALRHATCAELRRRTLIIDR